MVRKVRGGWGRLGGVKKVRDGRERESGGVREEAGSTRLPSVGKEAPVIVTRPPTAPLRGFSLEKNPIWSTRDGEGVREGEDGSKG